MRISIRQRPPWPVVAAGVAVLLAVPVAMAYAWPGTASGTPTTTVANESGSPPKSSLFSTVDLEQHATSGVEGDGDLWPSCWAEDGDLYAAHGDGKGFGDTFSDIGVNRISGSPGDDMTGTTLALGDDVGQVWTEDHTRKPTGMVCAGGDIYLAVQDLAKDFNDAPAATVAKSSDNGETWSWDTKAPMFDDGVFSTVMFLDYGKDNGRSPDGYVYAYGLDHNWRDSYNDRVEDPVDVYLARVPEDRIQSRSAWEFASGSDPAGGPTWSRDISDRKAVLHDDRHVYQDVYTADRQRNMTTISQGGVVYNKGLDRYLYTSWTEYTMELYESPTPWGPWKHLATKDFGGYPWNRSKHGGYATTIPSKFISDDGRSMWMQSNVCPCGGGGTSVYNFSLRRLALTPHTPSTPDNPPDGERNLATEPGTVPTQRVAHHGNVDYYNDGRTDHSEDDWNDERKPDSWWGYTWPRQYTMDRVAYTTGEMADDGGWFAEDLRVQVRRDHEWVDVRGLKVEPEYPYDATAGPNTTYELSFEPVAGDGVRVIGAPGGSRTFTSIAELEAHYTG